MKEIPASSSFDHLKHLLLVDAGKLKLNDDYHRKFPVDDITALTPISTARLKGVESEGAIHFQTDGHVISTAIEKRNKQHQSAPRVFSYDKAEIKRFVPGGSWSGASSNRASQIIPPSATCETDKADNLDASVQYSCSSTDIDADYNNNEAKHSRDRYVSTSYSESLDHILQQPNKDEVVINPRLAILSEESSRPTSAFVDTYSQQSGTAGGSDGGFNFDDMNFIQYTSQDIQYEQKKKVAKMFGRYIVGDTLGEGSYGKVKEGYCSETLQRVAIKIMKQSRLKKIPNGEQNVKSELSVFNKREIALLKKLRHKNVVELMDVIINKEKQKTYVVFEYCAATLQDILSRAPSGKLPISQSQRYFKHVVRGLAYVHAHGVIHRDIKPGNLLVTIDDRIKISDFGVAEEISMYTQGDLLTTSSGSPAFQPPEVTSGINTQFSGTKVDIWAIGVTLYHMVSGKYPFDGDSIYALFENISHCQYSIPSEADSILTDLIQKILEKDPQRRLDLEQISQHNWLKLQLLKSLDEVPVIPHVELSVSSGSQNSKSDVLEVVVDECTSQISNPNFAYDTTLIPYIETLYEDMPIVYRRSSATERMQYEKRLSEKNGSRTSAIAEKFLRRLSKPVIIAPLNPETPPKSSATQEYSPARKRQSSFASSFASQKTFRSKFSSRSDSDKSCKLQ